MQRYKLILQYCGTNYIGWQKQGKETRHKRSVQSTLEKAVHDFIKTPTHVNICGRTDAGVHAIANAAHIDLKRIHKKTGVECEPYSALQVKNAINHHLKAMDVNDIYVNHVELVDQDFHARFSALERTYVYKTALCRDSTGAVFDWDKRWYIRKQIDLEKVKEACKFFEGEHDYTTMKPATELSPVVVRTIRSFHFELETPTISAGYHEPIYANFYIRAKAFMQHQVRKIMGSVMLVGSGDITVDELRRRMEAKDTRLAPKMAPPNGLYFLHVRYPETTERNPESDLTNEQPQLLAWTLLNIVKQRYLNAEVMENNTEQSTDNNNIFLSRGRDVFILHILPLTALDWLYVSKDHHDLAFNNLLRDPRVIQLIDESRPLSKAVVLNNARAVSLLLTHPNVNPNEAFSRPLIAAIENGFDTIAEILLNDTRTKISYYFLDICITRKRLNIAKLLLKHGIKFEDEINFNRMLAKACENYLPELVAKLLDVYEDKAKININQALEISAICKHEDLFKLLLARRPANNRLSPKILLSMANYRVFDCAPLLCDQAEFIDIDEKVFKELLARTAHAKRTDLVQLMTEEIAPFVTKSID